MLVIDYKIKNNKVIETKFYDGTVLNLSTDIFVKYGIYKDKEISDKQFFDLKLENDKQIAFLSVIKWLNYGYRCEKEVKQYLQQKKIDENIQNYVLEKVKELGFINDENLAKIYIESNKNKFGKNKIEQKLYEKGINKTIINDCLKEYESQDELCYNLALKKIKSKEITRENLIKVSNFLIRNGFNYEQVKYAIKKIKNCEIE